MGTIKPPNAGMGRKPGAPNKITAAVKDAILHAFDKVGGEAYLVEVATKDHKTFCALLGRIVPRAAPETDDEVRELLEITAVLDSLARPAGARPPPDCAPKSQRWIEGQS